MHIFELMNSLEEELTEVFENQEYEVKSPTVHDPLETKKVDIGQGWKTSKKNKEEFPYILISPLENTFNWEEDILELMLIFGVHSMDDDGWKDAALMANKVKFHLNKKYIIGRNFPLTKEGQSLTISFPDARPYPQWFCFMTLRFNGYNAVVDPEWRGEYYDDY